MKRWLFCSLAAGAMLAAAASSSHAAELKAGDDAPDFEMTGSDGKAYKLADFKGKQAVVIAWFPKAFTGGCTKECQSLRDNGNDLRQYNAAYFTASCDTVELNTKFAQSLTLDYPILSDPDQKVAGAYGVLNPERKVPFRWTFYIGKDGKILHIDKAVATASHGADVAAKLKELGVEKK